MRWAVLGLIAIAAVAAAAPVAEIFKAEGSHYDIFFQYGLKYKQQINAFVDVYDELATLKPYVSTHAGRAAFDSLIHANSVAYPDYIDELSGISNGAGVPLDTLFILAFEDELSTLMQMPGITSCSDVHVNVKGGATLLAHNEDDEVYIESGAVIMHATIAENSRHPKYSFIAYMYPGFLPGIAFGFNSRGIALTCNAVFPVIANVSGLGNQFIARDILGAHTLDDAIYRATRGAACDGHSLNLMSFRPEDVASPVLTNIEIAMSGPTVLLVHPSETAPPLLNAGTFYHFNMYRVNNVEQYTDISSEARLAVADSMPVPNSIQSALAILGSQANASYPIYRTGTPPDCCTEPGPGCCATVASALFDLQSRTMAVYFANPALSQPTYVFNITVKD